ncbi:MAG: thiamine-monophosphate kinase [Candidatus Lokiarchaeota archaeon]|nr:thiamine-monophosphate kinase [Candidatus Lokiarchaeota archaeon]
MSDSTKLKELGEKKLIRIIEDIIFQKTGNHLLKDDSFFFKIDNFSPEKVLVFNSDMFVSTTDAPKEMTFYQMGRKSILMNISDLVVKGVHPIGVFISIGLPPNLDVQSFREIIEGMVDYCCRWNVNYIGGDMNMTNEIIINPTVFGFEDPTKIIYRKGINSSDIVIITSKFGLTGVGFEILLNRYKDINKFRSYERSIQSVLEPFLDDKIAFILAENQLSTASIDSSDGLARSLRDLMVSNPGMGFDINFDDNLVDDEARSFSSMNNLQLEELIFNAGEEFIHVFTISPSNYEKAKMIVKSKKGKIFAIGKVNSEGKIYINYENKRKELQSKGFEHFL